MLLNESLLTVSEMVNLEDLSFPVVKSFAQDEADDQTSSPGTLILPVQVISISPAICFSLSQVGNCKLGSECYSIDG